MTVVPEKVDIKLDLEAHVKLYPYCLALPCLWSQFILLRISIPSATYIALAYHYDCMLVKAYRLENKTASKQRYQNTSIVSLSPGLLQSESCRQKVIYNVLEPILQGSTSLA